MIDCQIFYNRLLEAGIDFFTGVPDSLLSDITACIAEKAGGRRHITAANEGGAVALAAGCYLATGKSALVYMQNSGLGNAVNPLLSLADPLIYGIPMLVMIGWRGEPGQKDEPQHFKQGKVTLPLLESMDIGYAVLPDSDLEAGETLDQAVEQMRSGPGPFALVVRKGTFGRYDPAHDGGAVYQLSREEALGLVLSRLGPNDVVVSTTGKLSREIYEYRDRNREGHGRDFLNVGSMGHASQVALGIALSRSDREVYCCDGDGAVIMHLGALAVAGCSGAKNFRHLVFNNGAHDSVGGQKTAGFQIDICGLAADCGYRSALRADTAEQLEEGLAKIMDHEGPALLEIRVHKGSRADLGRPGTSPGENKKEFMQFLQQDESGKG